MTPARALALIITACLIGAALLFFVAVAHAQAMCASRKDIEASLAKRYGEKPVFLMSASNIPMELYANEQTGTWTTLYFVTPDSACIGSTGEHFTRLPTGDPA